MKTMINNINIQIAAVCFFSLNLCVAQSQNLSNVSSKGNEIEAKIADCQKAFSAYETNIRTNDFAPSDKAFDQIITAMQPLKDAMSTLENPRSQLDRQQRSGLWLDILSAIDTNLHSSFLATNMGPVSINGYIPPPPGYHGKVGLYGMLPPDTNDTANYSYYIAAKKTYRVKRLLVNVHDYLDRLNLEATNRFGMFLRANYSSSDSDRQEITQLLNNANLSDFRQQELKQLFDKSHQ